MIFLAKASSDSKGGIEFSSEYTRAHFKDWLKENPDKPFKIDTNQKVSDDLRGYYFAAVLPLVRTTCDEWKNLNGEQLHEVLKKMFYAFEAFNPITKRTERFGRSIMADKDLNNTKKAMQYLNIIGEYLGSCGLEMPDSSEYVHWRDNAPEKGKEFKK